MISIYNLGYYKNIKITKLQQHMFLIYLQSDIDHFSRKFLFSFLKAPLMSREQLVEASSPPKFSGLPAGATQVGGNTLSLQVRQRNRPAPLSEVNYYL